MTRTVRRLAPLALAFALPALAGEGASQEPERRPFRTPPAEAIAACEKLALDAACNFTFDGRAHTGTCRRGPEGQGPIACAPDRHGEHGPSQGSPRGQEPQPPSRSP